MSKENRNRFSSNRKDRRAVFSHLKRRYRVKPVELLSVNGENGLYFRVLCRENKKYLIAHICDEGVSFENVYVNDNEELGVL